MEKNKGMDIIYSKDNRIVSIANLQKDAKQNVVDMYKECRKNQQLTQTTVAKLTGIPQPNITRFESDKSNPTLEMLVKMAAALGKKVVISLEDIEEK